MIFRDRLVYSSLFCALVLSTTMAVARFNALKKYDLGPVTMDLEDRMKEFNESQRSSLAPSPINPPFGDPSEWTIPVEKYVRITDEQIENSPRRFPHGEQIYPYEFRGYTYLVHWTGRGDPEKGFQKLGINEVAAKWWAPLAGIFFWILRAMFPWFVK